MKLDELPREVLDNIVSAVHPGSRLDFLLANKAIFCKCYQCLFRYGSVQFFCDARRAFGLDRYHRLRASQSFLDSLDKYPEMNDEVRQMHITNMHSSFTDKHKKKKNKKKKKYDDTLNFHYISFDELQGRLFEKFDRFTGIRMITCDIDRYTILKSLSELFPPNLKALVININHISVLNGIPTDQPVATEKFQPGRLKYLKIAYTGTKALEYRPFSLFSIWHARMVNRNAIFDEVGLYRMMLLANSDRKFSSTFKREEIRLQNLGTILGGFIARSAGTLYTIDVSGFDAYLIFRNASLHVTMDNLRVIKLCGRSIPKLSWWLPGFEAPNKKVRPTIKRGDDGGESLPPAVVIFSDLFQRRSSTKPKSKRYVCRVHFFGDPSKNWTTMSGKAKDFWIHYYYF